MTKKRASLAGRGVEILFGEEQEETSSSDSESLLAETPSLPANAQDVPAEEPAELAGEDMDAAWMAKLEEEASTAVVDVERPGEAEPVSETEAAASVGPSAMPTEFTATDGRPDWPIVHVDEREEGEMDEAEETLPDLGTEPAQLEDTLPLLATEPAQPMEPVTPVETEPVRPIISQPAVEPVTPPAPAYAELTELSEEPPAPLPPPREKPEVFGEVVLTEVKGPLFDSTRAPEGELTPEGPTSADMELRDVAEYEVGQPSRPREEDEILRFIGLKRRQDLWQEVEALYKEVPIVLSGDPKQADALQFLQEAQDILMERPRQFDVARYKVSQVQMIITTRRNITRWTNTYGWGTFVYLVVWFVALAAAILFAPVVVNWIASIVGETSEFIDVAQLWNTTMWGSVGGVLGALYSLYWHAAHVRDFHKQYLMWYIVQPVIGLVIGGFMYLIIGAGFLTAAGQTSSGQPTVLKLFPYAVSCVASFRQRFVLEIVDRFIQFLTGANRQQEEQKPPATAEIPTTSSSGS